MLWRERRSPEERFWEWFARHAEEIAAFENDRERVFDRICAALEQVKPGLVFEIGKGPNGPLEFVVSADGDPALIPAVHALCDAAPELPGWAVVRFRQGNHGGRLSLGEFSIGPEDVQCALSIEPDGRVWIGAYPRGYDSNEHEDWRRAICVLLDSVLGEFVMMTRVAMVEVLPASKAPEERFLTPLEMLPDVFDRAWESGRRQREGEPGRPNE